MSGFCVCVVLCALLAGVKGGGDQSEKGDVKHFCAPIKTEQIFQSKCDDSYLPMMPGHCPPNLIKPLSHSPGVKHKCNSCGNLTDNNLYREILYLF